MTGIQILKGSLPFRVRRFETGCWFCAVSCPVLSGDCTTGSYAMVVSIYQAIRRHVPAGVFDTVVRASHLTLPTVFMVFF